jgi:hypothetical protein
VPKRTTRASGRSTYSSGSSPSTSGSHGVGDASRRRHRRGPRSRRRRSRDSEPRARNDRLRGPRSQAAGRCDLDRAGGSHLHDHLPTDKVVLVSWSGYSKQARARAASRPGMALLQPMSAGPDWQVWVAEIALTLEEIRVDLDRPDTPGAFLRADPDIQIRFADGTSMAMGDHVVGSLDALRGGEELLRQPVTSAGRWRRSSCVRRSADSRLTGRHTRRTWRRSIQGGPHRGSCRRARGPACTSTCT